MRLKPTPIRPELERLLAKAREHKMTPAEIYEQRISFVYGQVSIESPHITKDMVRQAALETYGPPPGERDGQSSDTQPEATTPRDGNTND